MKKRSLPKINIQEIPNILPPRSLVQLISADDDTPGWKDSIGKLYRIGYYSPQDGLDTIWLVDENGEYCETTDHKYLFKYFRIIKLCKTKNYFGTHCKPLGPIKKR